MPFTQTLKMHLNGGNKFSALVYNVMRDGKPTGITRTKRTNGSPQYLIEVDMFVAEDKSEFDNLAARGLGLTEWLEEHSQNSP